MDAQINGVPKYAWPKTFGAAPRTFNKPAFCLLGPSVVTATIYIYLIRTESCSTPVARDACKGAYMGQTHADIFIQA